MVLLDVNEKAVKRALTLSRAVLAVWSARAR